MNVTIIRFPGTNCDLDTANAVKKVLGIVPKIISCKDDKIPKSDLLLMVFSGSRKNNPPNAGSFRYKTARQSFRVVGPERRVEKQGCTSPVQSLKVRIFKNFSFFLEILEF